MTEVSTAPSKVSRFDLTERLVHWVSAALFLVLVVTALPLYFPRIESVIGRRALLEAVHLWCGVALPVPLLVGAAGPWGVQLRRDVRRVNLWSPNEIGSLRSLGRRRAEVRDKFNPGQKLNALVVAGGAVVMLGTGLAMQWFSLFAINLRTGATFVHDVLATALCLLIIGHITMALSHVQELRSMVTGWIDESWAQRYRPGWHDEVSPVKPR